MVRIFRGELVALALAAATGALALGGCGHLAAASRAATIAQAGGAPAGSAQLVIGRVGDAVGLDPSRETDGLSLNVTAEIFQNLVRFRPGTFAIEPEIARSWTVSADGRRWTFHLKPGLTFSDGTPLDAQAVKFNFDRWRLPNGPEHGKGDFSYYESMFGGFPGLITDVQAPSPTEVVFVLKSPSGPFLRNLAMPPFAIGSPTAIRKDPEAFRRRPVASGPYALAEWVPDDHITLQANPRYDGPKPAYGTVIVRDIPDQATGVLSLQKGEIDGLTDPRPDDAKALGRQRGITVYEQPSNNNAYVAFNTEKRPFGDRRVRLALAHAIDVPALVRAFYAQGAQVANNWTPPGMLGENPAVKAYPHDPAKARALLAQAGFPRGFATELYYGTRPRPYLPEPQRVAEAIQANLRAVGVTVTLQPFEWGVFLSKIRNGEHPMCLIGWSGDNGDPDNFFYPLLDEDSAHPPNAQNYAFWRDPRFHRLMLAGQRTVVEAQRRRIYMQANAMVHDEVPALPFVHTTVPLAMRSSVGGVIPNPDTELRFELMRPAKAPPAERAQR